MKTIYKILFLSILGLFLFACSDDDDSPVSGSPLQLSVSSDTLVLLEENANDVALTFNWNKGVDHPSYDTVSYIFRLDMSTGDFTTTSTTPDTIVDFTKSYTTLELNKLLLNKWKIYPGEEAILTARVVAKVDGPKFVYPEIATINIVIQGYTPTPKPLYLMGSATSAGSDVNKAIKITEVEIGELYNWQGNLKAGGFKFITTQGKEVSSLNKGTDNTTVIERQTTSDPDNLFPVEKDGYYAISLFRENMKIDYKYIPYPNIYLVGNAGTGWGLPADMHEFTMDPAAPNVFTLTINLNPGELKLLTKNDWGAYTFRPMVDGASIYEEAVQGYSGGEDKKWRVNDGEGGNCKITLDVNNMKIKFEKL